jgi:hypothetical protein
LGVYKSHQISEEMTRVTKKKGRIFISFPAAASVSGVLAKGFLKLGWNPTLLDFWYTKKEITDILPEGVRLINLHRLGFEPPFQRLYKKIVSRGLVQVFIFLEKNLRDKPLFKYFGSRFFVEAIK